MSGSLTTALVARAMLEKHPGRRSSTTSSARRSSPRRSSEYGGTAVRTRVGHSFIKQVMADTGAVFGGEHSGHYYFRDNYRADSGLIAAMVVLEELSARRRAAVGAARPVPPVRRLRRDQHRGRRPRRRGRGRWPSTSPAEGLVCDRTDGLTVDFGDWWFNLRPSNTEPLLRLNVEASTPGECDRHVAEVLELVAEVPGGVDRPPALDQ